MKDHVQFGQKGSCFSAECYEINAETYGEVKEFCKLKVFSGYPPEYSIIISAKDEIRYLTIGGIIGNIFPVKSRQNFGYQLEF
ncbi:MAG: hypothetical protein PHF33_10095 [Candidatus Delongbacteria bacterium]|jgi:hypothetical protein|nr:hypothetical protein [Candidatus Delongbacteria bacterium]MDD4205627.1 hypothetical protein [Candidatus Delongbacteria bacterium]MDY0018096.1 hypothetical protein [Candidatus Delongbacteria bacterium]